MVHYIRLSLVVVLLSILNQPGSTIDNLKSKQIGEFKKQLLTEEMDDFEGEISNNILPNAHS